MKEILDHLAAWTASGTRFALATVVRTWRSSPRPPGAAMAVSEHGEVVGSVSGGCVEGAVYELAQHVLASGVPVLESYGVGDGDAFAVGLTCGGALEVLVRLVDADSAARLADLAAAVRAGRPAALATVVGGAAGQVGADLVVRDSDVHGSIGSLSLDREVTLRAEGLLAHAATAVIRTCPATRPAISPAPAVSPVPGGSAGPAGPAGSASVGPAGPEELDILVQSFTTPPRMLVFGAIDFAGAVARIGTFLGYRVTVCDARPVFATAARFPDADEVVVDWPHRYLARTAVDERTVVCVLTHDPKFDIPLLEVALRTNAAYVGAMGSRRTHEVRLELLREAGLDETELARLSSPIGLDLGARTPQETAVSIAAEIVARTRGGTGVPLSRTGTPIHPR